MDNNLIKKLETFRLNNKITQQELARILNVNFTTVSRWLNGKTNPSKIQLFQIEKLLKEGPRYAKKTKKS